MFEAEDPEGLRCPLSAHIRKVNPRDVTTEQGGANDTLTRLVVRRGIAYGPPAAPEPWRVRRDDGIDRGLLFAAHMASIVDQFEFLPQNWTNDPLQPEGGGHDPLVGQEDAGARQRFVEIRGRRTGRRCASASTARWSCPRAAATSSRPRHRPRDRALGVSAEESLRRADPVLGGVIDEVPPVAMDAWRARWAPGDRFGLLARVIVGQGSRRARRRRSSAVCAT